MIAKRLLVIDDEPDFGASVRLVAERLGFEVEVTTRARDFMTAYDAFDPTVIILDMIMPDMDGIELVQWLVSVRSTARIIIISGFSPTYAKSAATLGAAKGLLSISRLVKPVSLAILTATLTSALLEPGAPPPSSEIG
jgi:DNA-binding response OmpR family regulator